MLCWLRLSPNPITHIPKSKPENSVNRKLRHDTPVAIIIFLPLRQWPCDELPDRNSISTFIIVFAKPKYLIYFLFEPLLCLDTKTCTRHVCLSPHSDQHAPIAPEMPLPQDDCLQSSVLDGPCTQPAQAHAGPDPCSSCSTCCYIPRHLLLTSSFICPHLFPHLPPLLPRLLRLSCCCQEPPPGSASEEA